MNEELLAEAIGNSHQYVKIATKFGFKIINGKIVGRDSSPTSIRRAVEGSLRRLRRERIDLLYQHRIDPGVPIEDVVGTMKDLIIEGKVDKLGLSAIDALDLERAQTVHTISAVQNEYSLIERQIEAEVLPCIERHGTTLVPFSPLGQGILCGNALSASNRSSQDYRKSDAKFSTNRLRKINAQLQPLWRISKQYNVPPAVISLAWLLGKSPKIFIIPGAKSLSQISINVQATKIHLTIEEVGCLDSIFKYEAK